jgi:hypothetical protein
LKKKLSFKLEQQLVPGNKLRCSFVLQAVAFKSKVGLSLVYVTVYGSTLLYGGQVKVPEGGSHHQSPPLPRITWQPSMTIGAFALVLLTVTQLSNK